MVISMRMVSGLVVVGEAFETDINVGRSEFEEVEDSNDSNDQNVEVFDGQIR
jgi:hypothetical protein